MRERLHYEPGPTSQIRIARRGYRSLEILADIAVLRKRGCSAEIIEM